MARSSSGGEKSLVIVESPAKARTINKYLGSAFEVKASMGHVVDLPSKGLNVDIANGFEPTYQVIPSRKKAVAGLKAAARKCGKLYLATDLDREGEAIAWHLANVLGVPEERTFRVIFNAITPDAIKRAFDHPGKLDTDKVMAQQARRILDRIVGYQISPLLWKKVATGLSAGRVQSVAVKLIVERERKIRAFKPEEYWLVPAVFTADLKTDYSRQWLDFIASGGSNSKPPTAAEQAEWLSGRNAFKAELSRVGEEKFKARDKQTAERICDSIRNSDFKVTSLETRESVSRPPAPFITSTLQQAASNQLGFSAARTMRIAQQLYEGLEVGSMGSIGLITYMRTDSTHIAGEAISEVRRHIGGNIGPEYLPEKPRHYASRKSAQQAHEAIRPTDVDLVPDEIRSLVTDEQYRLYNLIWRRFLACQMTSAKWLVTNLEVLAETGSEKYTYRATGKRLTFDGFSRLWRIPSPEQPLPPIKQGQALRAVDIRAEQHFTKPPARYTEASLVKALEKEGIGRPSTYANIISTVQDRGYVEQIERKFHSTDLGEVVTDKLCEHFSGIMDIAFTSHMEEQLDRIEEKHLDWLSVLEEFYAPFSKNLETAREQMKHAKAETTPSDYDCPECGSKLMYRFGKKGRFLSCSTYPECKFASQCDRDGRMLAEEITDHECPKCGKPMVKKTGRFGPFLGCSGYPECRGVLKLDKSGNILPPKPPAEGTGIKCYKCKDGELLVRKSKRGPFLGCGRFPKCRTIISIKQLEKLKALQASGEWPPASTEDADRLLGREKKKAKK